MPPVGQAPVPIPSLGYEGWQGIQVRFRVFSGEVALNGVSFTLTYLATTATGDTVTITDASTGATVPFYAQRSKSTKGTADLAGQMYDKVIWPPTLVPCTLTYTARADGVPRGTEVVIEVTDAAETHVIPVTGNEYAREQAGQLYVQFTVAIPFRA
jgi:hypothetical protein